MRTIYLLLFAPLVFGQIQTFSGVNGIGHSTYQCLDRDGDARGVGLTSIINTTVAGSFSAGSQTLTPVNMSGTMTGTTTSGSAVVNSVNIEGLALQVGMTVSGTGIPANTTILSLYRTFGQAYGPGPITLSQNATASGSVTLTVGIGAGVALRIGTAQNMEKVLVSSATASTFTATFAIAHAAATPVSDQGCLARDADDLDPNVWTAAQAISKYVSLTTFLKHLGYATTGNIYYVDYTTGVDTGSPPACKNTIGSPCRTTAYIRGSLAPNDIVMYRNGFQSRIDAIGGSAGNSIIYMAYPGEIPIFDPGVITSSVFQSINVSNWTIDGLKFQNASVISGGTDDSSSAVSEWANIIVRHVEGVDGPNSLVGVMEAFNGLQNFTVEDSVWHDNSIGHGIYIGSREIVSDTVTIRRNLVFTGADVGIQWNGRLTNGVFNDNVIYDFDGNCFDFEEGSSGSLVYNNLCFGAGSKAFNQQSYDGNEGAMTCGASGTALCTCPNIQFHGSCPFSQNNNVFENNLVYNTGISGYTGFSASNNYAGFQIAQASNCTTATCLSNNFDNNIWRNNIVAVYTEGGGAPKPPFVFSDNSNGMNNNCPSGTGKCAEWVSTSTFANTVGFCTDGSGCTGLFLGAGSTLYTCSTGTSQTTISGLCVMADPKFSSASTSLANLEMRFDFRLLNSSPALNTGTATGIPNYDLAGRSYTGATPSIGPLERNPWTFGWNILSGVTVQSVMPPDNTVCNQSGTVYTQSCDNAGSPYAYSFFGPSLIDAWGGGAPLDVPGAAKLFIAGGGHGDYGGNQVLAINLARTTPNITRIVDPSFINTATYSTCNYANADGTPRSIHYYGTPAFIPGINKLFRYGGAVYCGAGVNFSDTWEFNPTNATWAHQDPTACPSTCGTSVGGYEQFFTGSQTTGSPDNYSAYDPNTGHVFSMLSHAVVSEYNPTNNSYIRAANFGSAISCVTAAFCPNAFVDPNLKNFWIFGGTYAYQWDISGPSYPLPFTDQTSSVSVSGSTDCSAIFNAQGPGISWNPALAMMVGYPGNSGANVVLFNTTTLGCTTLTPPGTAPSSGTNPNGLWGRFSYFNSLDITALVNDYSVNAAVLSLNAPDPNSGAATGFGGVKISGPVRRAGPVTTQ